MVIFGVWIRVNQKGFLLQEQIFYVSAALNMINSVRTPFAGPQTKQVISNTA